MDVKKIRIIGYISGAIGGIAALVSLWAENKMADDVDLIVEEKIKELGLTDVKTTHF